jgi:hypothetical protein
MKIVLFPIVVMLAMVACGRPGEGKISGEDIPFDTIMWDTRKGDDYPYRKYMLKDITANYDWKGQPREAVRALLGPPDSGDSNVYVYRIELKRLNLLPLRLRALVFRMDSTGHVKAVRIYE